MMGLACGPGSDDSRADAESSPTATQPTVDPTADPTATTQPTSEATDPSGTVPTTSAGSASSAGSSGGADTTTTETPSTSTTEATSTSTTDNTTAETSDSDSEKLDLAIREPEPIPVKEIPGLMSITFYETTGQVFEYTFSVDGPELNTLLPDPLGQQNRDIQGTSVEFYDVYYSNEDGTFNAEGSYLTIAGAFGAKLPAGGGLNLAEISLNYADNSVEFGSFLASFQGLGDNYAAGSEPNAIDGKLETHTTMGNNVDEPDKRLRVTLGFMSSLMPG